jgi:hypothetical protein
MVVASIGTPDGEPLQRWFTTELMDCGPQWMPIMLMALLKTDAKGEYCWRSARETPLGLIRRIAHQAARTWSPELLWGEDGARKIAYRDIPMSTFNRQRDGYRNDRDGHDFGRESSNTALESVPLGRKPKSGLARYDAAEMEEHPEVGAYITAIRFDLDCPGGPTCTCCTYGCHCGCRDACPAYEDFLNLKFPHGYDEPRPGDEDLILLRGALDAGADEAGHRWLASEAKKRGYSTGAIRSLKRRHERNCELRNFVEHAAAGWNQTDPERMPGAFEKTFETDIRKRLCEPKHFDWNRIAERMGMSHDEAVLLKARFEEDRTLRDVMVTTGWDAKKVHALDRDIRRKLTQDRLRFQRAIAGEYEDPELFILLRRFQADVSKYLQARRK